MFLGIFGGGGWEYIELCLETELLSMQCKEAANKSSFFLNKEACLLY